MAEVAELIARSHGDKAADEFRKFEPSQDDFKALKQAGRELQIIFKPIPGACAVMSALLLARLQSLTTAPAYVVAGNLWVGNERVFGFDEEPDWSKAFSATNMSWDGHAWAQFGRFVVDMSVFRTAYSDKSPPTLAKHVLEHHGKGRGILIATYEAAAREDGLLYEPKHVLTQSQLDPLINGGLKMLNLPGSQKRQG
jgi:hypothetical protein